MVDVSSIDFAELNPLVMARVGMLNYNGDIGSAWSEDGGATWMPIGGVPPGAGLGSSVSGTTAMVAVSANGSTYVWAPPDSVPAYIRNGPWVSSTGAPVGLRVVSDRVNPNKFYGYDAATGIVYASTDGGVSFAARATGLPRTWGRDGRPKVSRKRFSAGKETCGCRRRAVSTTRRTPAPASPGSARLRALPWSGSAWRLPAPRTRHIRRWDSERRLRDLPFRRYGRLLGPHQ